MVPLGLAHEVTGRWLPQPDHPIGLRSFSAVQLSLAPISCVEVIGDHHVERAIVERADKDLAQLGLLLCRQRQLHDVLPARIPRRGL